MSLSIIYDIWSWLWVQPYMLCYTLHKIYTLCTIAHRSMEKCKHLCAGINPFKGVSLNASTLKCSKWRDLLFVLT